MVCELVPLDEIKRVWDGSDEGAKSEVTSSERDQWKMATSEKLYKGLSRRSEWAHSDKGGDDDKFNFMHDFCKCLLIDEEPATASGDDKRGTAAGEDELKGEIAEQAKEKAEKEKEQEGKRQIRMAYEILCTRIKRDCDGQPLLGPAVPGW
jgi:hypothetical protein